MPEPRPGPLVLGIDLGTSSVKVLVASPSGAVAGRGRADHPVLRPAPDRAEQAPAAWWAATRRAVAAALGAAGPGSGRRVEAIACAGQMHGTVLVGPDGAPDGNAVIWLDRAAAGEAAAIAAELGEAPLRGLAGGPVAAGFQAATLRRIRRTDPARLDAAIAVLAPKDALRLRLTGELATDPSDASGTGLLDVARRAWAPRLAAAAGIGPALLPPILASDEVAGPLLATPAAELGLRPGIPVAVGAADTAAGLLGAGVTGPGRLLLTIGSGGQVALPAEAPAPDASGRSHLLCSVLDPGAGAPWYRLAATLAAGLALAWLRGVLLDKEPGGEAALLAAAAGVPPGARGLRFLPHLAGERSPLMDPAARGLLSGLTLAHGRPEIARAVVEGVTLGLLEAALVLVARDALPPELVLAGGGARDPGWRAVVADCFDRPVRPLATGEQTALGAAILAAAAVGLADPAADPTPWAELGPATPPDRERAAAYRELHASYAATWPAVGGAVRRLGGLEAGPPGAGARTARPGAHGA